MKKSISIFAVAACALLCGCEAGMQERKAPADNSRDSNARATYEALKAAKSGAVSLKPKEAPKASAPADSAAESAPKFELLPNPAPMRAPVARGELMRPELRIEHGGDDSKGLKFIVPYFKAGNKEVYVRRAGKVRTLKGANFPAIFIDGEEVALFQFWGVTDKGFGYPFPDIEGDPETVEADERAGVFTYRKPYIDNSGKRAVFVYTMRALDDGKIEVEWDTGSDLGAAPWVHFKNYRDAMISFNGKPWSANSVDAFAGRGEISGNVRGSVEVNGGAPVRSYRVLFENDSAYGSLTETYVRRDERDIFGLTYRTNAACAGKSNKSGKFVIDLGECAVARDVPPPSNGMDFWEFDLTHLPKSPTRNLIPNPSFEQGLRYWKCRQGRPVYDPQAPDPVSIVGDARHGGKALKLDGVALWSFPIPLDPNKKYMFSLYAKRIDEKTPPYFNIAFQNAAKTGGKYPGKWGRGDFASKQSNKVAASDWQRFERVVEGDAAGLCIVLSGHAIIDALQLEEIPSGTPSDSAKPTEFVPVPVDGNFVTSEPCNDLSFGAPIGAKFEMVGKPGAQARVKLSIKNMFYETVFEKSYDVKIGPDGTASFPVDLDSEKIGQGIFVVRADFMTGSFAPYSEYYRFDVMKKLSNTHPTKNIFGTGIADITGHHYDVDKRGRKFMEWGFGSGSWYNPVQGLDYEKNVRQKQSGTDVMIKYRLSNMLFNTHTQYSTTSILKEMSELPYYTKWEKITPEMEKLIEEEAYLTVKNYPQELLISVAFGNEEEGYTAGKYDEYVKAQHAVYRGAKRANPNVLVAPTNGTSGYNIHRGRDAIDGYLEAANKRGFKYDVVAIHPYGNYDYDPIWDFDENLGYLISRMKHYGYPDDTPIFCTECGNICDAEIPPWNTHWYDHYNAGKVSYDFGNQEIFQACVHGRNYLAALKYWPKVQSVNIWTYMPYIDYGMSPLLICKTVNTLGNLYPDVKHIADIRPSAKVRGYAFELKDGTGIAAVWTTDMDVNRSRAPSPIMRVKFDQPVEYIDFAGNPRSAAVDKDGLSLIPLTGAPLSIKAKDPRALAKALQEGEVEDTSSDIALSFSPRSDGGMNALIANATGRALKGKLFVGKSEYPYALPPNGKRILPLEGSAAEGGTRMCTLYKWSDVFRIEPERGAEVSGVWKMDYFYVPQAVNGAPDWASIPQLPLNNKLFEADAAKRAAAPKDTSGTYQLAWDGANLYLKVNISDRQVLDFPDIAKDPKSRKNLYWFDCSLNVCFDIANDGRRKRAYDTNDYVYHIAPPADCKDGKGLVWRWHDVDQQLADGISHASAEEAAAGIDCRFKRTKSGCEYIITFPKRYIEPLKLRSGTACGFGLFLHDRDKNSKGEVVYGGVSNATEPGVHTDNSPQFWPLMIFR